MPDRMICLEPINATFDRKVLNVSVPIKIGRKVSQKVAPESSNGLFESKVLSRNHAEIGCLEDGTFYIQDLGSSNGTFVNGMRLSDEGVPSEQHALGNDDRIDFGVDILKEDNEVLYSRVSCRALLNQRFPGDGDRIAVSASSLQGLLSSLDDLLSESLKTKQNLAVLHSQVDDMLVAADAAYPSHVGEVTDEQDLVPADSESDNINSVPDGADNDSKDASKDSLKDVEADSDFGVVTLKRDRKPDLTEPGPPPDRKAPPGTAGYLVAAVVAGAVAHFWRQL